MLLAHLSVSSRSSLSIACFIKKACCFTILSASSKNRSRSSSSRGGSDVAMFLLKVSLKTKKEMRILLSNERSAALLCNTILPKREQGWLKTFLCRRDSSRAVTLARSRTNEQWIVEAGEWTHVNWAYTKYNEPSSRAASTHPEKANARQTNIIFRAAPFFLKALPSDSTCPSTWKKYIHGESYDIIIFKVLNISHCNTE